MNFGPGINWKPPTGRTVVIAVAWVYGCQTTPEANRGDEIKPSTLGKSSTNATSVNANSLQSKTPAASSMPTAGLAMPTTKPGKLNLLVPAAPNSAPPPEVELSSLQPGPQDLLLVACGISDPGNLGALARAAEAAGARALVQVAGGVSPWNVRALRGSMGSLLRLPVVCGAEAGEVAQALAAQGWKSVAAATREGQPLGEFDWSGPRALWVSGETSGDPECFAEFDQVTIPMAGQVESLNVTVAGALLLFAAGRVGGS